MKITFADYSAPSKNLSGKTTIGTVCVAVHSKKKLSNSAKDLDAFLGGSIKRALQIHSFDGKLGETLVLSAPHPNMDAVVLYGVGDGTSVNRQQVEELGGQLYVRLHHLLTNTVSVYADALADKVGARVLASAIASGVQLRSWHFRRYLTTIPPKKVFSAITILCSDVRGARADFATAQKVNDGVFMTRELVSEPSNVLYPETLAKEAAKLSKLGVKVDILTGAQMKKLGMGALLGVAQGSVRDPRLVVMHWQGGAKAGKATVGKAKAGKKNTDAPIAFVGKGVTFDTGGISLKMAAGMEDMKWDMGGAGVVIGLMKALAGRKANVNVVGVVGLVENMPDGNAQRPGDIVTSMSGQTIEVLNTDAEGRLVLADALHYCKKQFNPQAIVDLATLTGAIIIALGGEYAGMFSNDDALSTAIDAAGHETGEKVWRMPLGDAYDQQLQSGGADMKNISNGREAGSIIAAQFLQRFVGDTPWAHLDIAGVTWNKKGKALCAAGATGFGVRLLNQFVRTHYEAKASAPKTKTLPKATRSPKATRKPNTTPNRTVKRTEARKKA